MDTLEQVRTEELTKITEAANNIFNSLNHNNVLPENIFREHFLPSFLGEKDNDKCLTEWASIAGSPASPVDIIDDNNNILFTVPPLYDSATMKVISEGNSKRINDIYAESGLRTIPSASIAYFKDSIDEKLQNSKSISEQLFNENKEKWDNILMRYGRLNQRESYNRITESDDSMLSYD